MRDVGTLRNILLGAIAIVLLGNVAERLRQWNEDRKPDPPYVYTGATPNLPKAFDPQQHYKAYKYPDLGLHVAETVGTTNAFVGERVKVFATILPDFSFSSLGCLSSKVCEHGIPVIDTNQAFFSRVRLEPIVYIADNRRYEEVKTGYLAHCDLGYPCHLLVAGTLRYQPEESFMRHMPLFPQGAAYIDCDFIQVVHHATYVADHSWDTTKKVGSFALFVEKYFVPAILH